MDICRQIEDSNRYRSYVRHASKFIVKCKHRQHRLIAMLIKGGNIISVGWNSGHIHAEHAAINRAWRTDMDKTTLVVLRMRKDGSLAMAKPCLVCSRFIAQSGIKRVVYSDNGGAFKMMRVTDSMIDESFSKRTQVMMWNKVA